MDGRPGITAEGGAAEQLHRQGNEGMTETAIIIGNVLSICAMISDAISGTRKNTARSWPSRS